NNLQFRLGVRHATRLIRVSAVWKDGRPVTNGLVWCHRGSDWANTYTDLHGKATCEVIADREYTVTVARLIWAASNVETQNVQSITVAPDSKMIDLTIDVPLTNFNPTQQPVPGQSFARKPGKLW